MPDTSARLALPYLLPAQAQKHVTHNEALDLLDLLVQLRLIQFDAEIPPATAAAGAAYGLGADPQGAWSGAAGQIAAWDGAAWQFVAPQEGWRAWGLAEGELRVFRSGAWVLPAAAQPATLAGLDGLGIATSPDATNRLALAAPASLFSHAGAGHQMKLNKATAADTASLLFQTGWSGRAEIGLAGDDDLVVKVSADGATWAEALRIAPDGGLRIGGATALHHGNLLGVVSQQGGLPGGAVMESGQTAQGSYLRLADGTQICTARLDAQSAGPVEWTYPMPFAAPPVISALAVAAALSVPGLEAAPGLTAASFSTRDTAGARRADPVCLTATGRWF